MTRGLRTPALAVALILLILTLLGRARAQGPAPQGTVGTAFTYQGYLTEAGSPANGTYDLRFALYDAASGGTQVGSLLSETGVSVRDGRFTVQLDFGNVFDGTALWLEVAVRPSGSGSYTVLAPRQALAPAPYAGYASSAPWSGLTGVPAGFADGVDDDTTYSAGSGLTLSGGQFALDTAYTDARYWKLGGNGGLNPTSQVLGTTDGVTVTLVVSGVPALRLGPVAPGGSVTTPNVIGGSAANVVSPTALGGTIAGGGSFAEPNRIDGTGATVGGGMKNGAINSYATVGGGLSNDAAGKFATVSGGRWNGASGLYGAIGGGRGNQATGIASTVGGGYLNQATASKATVGGGQDNEAAGSYGTVAGGYRNVASGVSAFVGGGGYVDTALRTGNEALAPASSVVGGVGNVITSSASFAAVGGGLFNYAGALTVTIGGGAHITVTGEAAAVAGGAWITVTGPFAAVGGGAGHTVTGTYAAVGGGRLNQANALAATVGGGTGNRASGQDSTVAGGDGNAAGGDFAAVSGGQINEASGLFAAVGGGHGNVAGGRSAAIGGGEGNNTSANYTTVAGGSGNAASALYATVPGGDGNTAAGAWSFAAGRRAKALHDGAFVWADSTNANLNSPAANTFVVRASGGIWFGDTSTPSIRSGAFLDTSTGGYLSTGGTWTNASDRNLKTDFAAVDPISILERVARMPIQTWRYRAEGPSVRHLGPTAQDFYGAFGLGPDDTHIATVDADGVALTAIQGLYLQNQALRAENGELRARVEALEGRIAALEARRGGMPLSGAGILLLAGAVAWGFVRKEGEG